MSWTVRVKTIAEFEDILDENGEVDGEKLKTRQEQEEVGYECDECGYYATDSE